MESSLAAGRLHGIDSERHCGVEERFFLDILVSSFVLIQLPGASLSASVKWE